MRPFGSAPFDAEPTECLLLYIAHGGIRDGESTAALPQAVLNA